jgi:hypothetical protein
MKEKYCEKCEKVVIWAPDEPEVGENYIKFPFTCRSGNSRHFCKDSPSGKSIHEGIKCGCLERNGIN